MANDLKAQHSSASLKQAMSGRTMKEPTECVDTMDPGRDELEDGDSSYAPFMPRAHTIEQSDAPTQAQDETPEDEPATLDSTRTTTPTKKNPTVSKRPTSTPESKKRKSRNTGYADDSDSEYRATSSRKSSRRRRASFDSDPDGDYGGSATPTRTMTRPIRPRFPRRSIVDNSDGDMNEEDSIDERGELCLESCNYYEAADMLECEGWQCRRRKFHSGCVGFRAKPPLGDGRWWFCFECRKVEQKGMKTNGIFVEGEEDGKSEGQE